MTTVIKFYIADMTCKHCVKALTTAIQNKEPNAKVEIDLTKHQLSIKSTIQPFNIEQIIKQAGFTPQPI